jgi:hypothetical protein
MRLTKITAQTGDCGTTVLADGTRAAALNPIEFPYDAKRNSPARGAAISQPAFRSVVRAVSRIESRVRTSKDAVAALTSDLAGVF